MSASRCPWRVGIAVLVLATIASGIAARAQTAAVVNYADFYAAPDLVSWNAAALAKERGVDMKMVVFPGGGNDMLASLASGSSDAADLSLMYVMRAMDTGIKLKVLMGTGHKGTAVIARTSIKSLADLKGRTIGAVPGGPAYMSGLHALRSAGLDPAKDVKIVNIGNAGQGQALASGQVDAVMTVPEVLTSLMRSNSVHYIYTPDESDPAGRNNSALVVRADYAARHPEVVQKLVDAHYASYQAIEKMQRDDLDGLIAQASRLYAAGGVPEDTLRIGIPIAEYRPSLSLEQLKEYAKLVYGFGITKKNVADLWTDYLDFSYLAKASGQPADSFMK